MNRPVRSVALPRGFTLLETLIALMISAAIVLALAGALRLGYRAQHKGLRDQELNQRMRILSDRVSWLLRGAYLYQTVDGDEPVIMFKGEGDSIGLVTSSTDTYTDSLADAVGLKWVELEVNGRGLVMREKLFFMLDDPEGYDDEEFVLDPDVVDMELEYLDLGDEEDREEGDFEEDWVDEWDEFDQLYLPSAIKVRLRLSDGDERVDVPEIYVAVRAGGAPMGAVGK